MDNYTSVGKRGIVKQMISNLINQEFKGIPAPPIEVIIQEHEKRLRGADTKAAFYDEVSYE